MNAHNPETAASLRTFPTGFGQSDTRAMVLNDGRPNPSPLAGTPYATITSRQIVAMLSNPQSVPKDRAQWFIGSTYAEHDARSSDAQRERGQYLFLPIDIDDNDLSLEDVVHALNVAVPGVSQIVYSSRSAKASARRWRALVPLAAPLSGSDYRDTQEALFESLEAATAGVLIPCRGFLTPAQPIYLPNAGEHYEHHSSRGHRLDLTDHAITRLREQRRAERVAVAGEAQRRREQKARERAARASDGDVQPVDHFNDRHTVEQLLGRYGYVHGGGDDWRSPMQTSGSFATRSFGDYWISLSASDAAAEIGAPSKSGHRFGDAFDLFGHFEHDGKFTEAVRAYAQEAGLDGTQQQYAGGDGFDWRSKASNAQEQTDGAGGAAEDGQGTAGDPAGPGWREPDARFLRTILPEAPTLPLEDMLAPGWARWVRTAADSKGAPADYVLASLLSTAGAMIGNSRWAAPWDGWAEPPIWWTVAIGNPSAGKSPGLDAVLSAVKRVERDARQAAEQEVATWKVKAEVARLVESTWKEEVKAALKSSDALPEKPREADPGPEPVMPRYALADATVEKLAVIVSRQPRGILMARDELSGWLGNMSRYSGGSDRPFWLEAYGGRGYSVERMGREPVWIDHLSIGVVGGIQPDKLKSLLFKTDDDGLLARFMPVWPDPAPIKRPEAGIDDAFIEAALRKLLTLRMVATESGEERPWYIPFTEEARGYLNDFRKDARQWEADQEGLLLSFIGKLPGMAVRLSLILAYLDWATGGPDPYDITAEHFARAAGFIEAYALPMARRAYADGSTPKETRAGTKLAAIIIEAGWQRFTTSDILRLNRSGLDTKADLDPALDALETGDLIRALTTKTEGRGRGRPSRTFIVNPLLGSAR